MHTQIHTHTEVTHYKPNRCIAVLTFSSSLFISLSVIWTFFGSRPQLTTGPITAARTVKSSTHPSPSSPIFLQAKPPFCSTLNTMETQGREALPTGPVAMATEEADWGKSASSLLLFLPSSAGCFLSVTSPAEATPLCLRRVTMATDGLRMWRWSRENCR